MTSSDSRRSAGVENIWKLQSYLWGEAFENNRSFAKDYMHKVSAPALREHHLEGSNFESFSGISVSSENDKHGIEADSYSYLDFRSFIDYFFETESYGTLVTAHASGTPFGGMIEDFFDSELLVVDYSSKQDMNEVEYISGACEMIEGRTLFVDDVIDSGRTAAEIGSWCLRHGAEEVVATAYHTPGEEVFAYYVEDYITEASTHDRIKDDRLDPIEFSEYQEV